MAMLPYYGTYCRFTTKDKKDGSILTGADNLVGDVFDIVFQQEEDCQTAWMKNRFGAIVGRFDEDMTQQLLLCQARKWRLQAILVSVYFTEKPAPGSYWGEAAIVCYSPNDAFSFDRFMRGVGSLIAEGIRPDIDLGRTGFEHVVSSEGAWVPDGRVPKIDPGTGSILMKSHLTFNEKMVEKARNRNPGCLFLGWVFLLAVIALIVVALKSCGAF
jgi:hypothetical protein